MLLNINLWIPKTDALGPGKRAVIWVQGCKRNCTGCISPEMKPNVPILEFDTIELVGKILKVPDIVGITVSGGEPFDQPDSLLNLLKATKKSSSLTTMVYTGYTMEELKDSITMSICLEYIDLLVDGTFDISLPSGLWRGSSNQRFFSPSGYYKQDIIDNWEKQPSGVLDFRLIKGKLFTIGIPERSFVREFKKRLKGKGIIIEGDEFNE